uniref:Large ribosomal subunit protein eL13 n=1 Tax=Henneguya salminicola TaxID=69463 RepID=A0A6G3MIL1_HENSL
MRHNNALPDHYLRKHWQNRVKTWFNQPARKKARRLARKAKEAKMFPRPSAGFIRPIVQCPTLKHNLKSRLGRGFTLEELKAAKVPKLLAKTIGISVDFRRKNRSAEALEKNVNRLKKYKANLVLLPKKMNEPKKDDAPISITSMITQYIGDIYPVINKRATARMVSREAVNQKFQAFMAIKKARGDVRNLTYRKKKAEQVAV